MITESFRKRRMSDNDEDSAVAYKKRYLLPNAFSSAPASTTCSDYFAEASHAATKSTATIDQAAQLGTDLQSTSSWRRKENRSPNLTMLDQLQAKLDMYTDTQDVTEQVAALEVAPASPTQSSEGLLNLLLLADSSLQDVSGDQSDTTRQQGAAEADQSNGDSEQCTSNPSDADSEQSHDDGDCHDDAGNDSSSEEAGAQTTCSTTSAADAPRRPITAGLRPRITAQVASLMSVSIDLDSDSSSEEEEEATPVKRHKGMGRYGQDLHNTASLALRQTNLLKKKCANRTTKTVRQLRSAKEHSCEAAQKAVEATKAAEKAVQNLAQFADAFDDLVKQAVHAANAAAQSRADYAASVVAADLAEARRDRVVSKRGKRRSASPKTPKRMSWAADEHLVQERVFSKADPPSAASCALSSSSPGV